MLDTPLPGTADAGSSSGLPSAAPRGRHWPTPAQAPLLRAALGRCDEARLAWQVLRRGLDPTRRDRAAERLYPLLAANLRRLGVEDELARGLDAWRRRAEVRNRALWSAARPLLLALTEAGIDTVVRPRRRRRGRIARRAILTGPASRSIGA